MDNTAGSRVRGKLISLNLEKRSYFEAKSLYDADTKNSKPGFIHIHRVSVLTEDMKSLAKKMQLQILENQKKTHKVGLQNLDITPKRRYKILYDIIYRMYRLRKE